MNHISLKRRRPYGHEDLAVFPNFAVSRDSCQSGIDFTSLSPELQSHLDQTASFYGISGKRLHQLAVFDQATNKRHCSMSSHTMSSHSFPGQLPSGRQFSGASCGHHDGHGMDAVNDRLPLAGAQQTHLQTVADGLANLKLIFCPTCLTRWQGSEESYQALPGSEQTTLNAAEPYQLEKPPTALPETQEFLSSPLNQQGESPSLATQPDMQQAFMPHYPGFNSVQPLEMPRRGQGTALFLDTSQSETVNCWPNSAYSGAEGSITFTPSAFSGHSNMVTHPSVQQPLSEELVPVNESPPLDDLSPHSAVFPQYDGTSRHLGQNHHQQPPMGTYHNAYTNFDVVFPHQKPPVAKRGPFKDKQKREQTAQTRRMGSCIRCRMQRIRCEANDEDKSGPCLTCRPKQNTKIWRLPCLRVKITDIKLFKPGQVRGYEWTQRWKNSIVDNINNWEPGSQDCFIKVSEGYVNSAVKLRVRRFIPQKGDKLERSWADPVRPEVKRSVPIPPYAIVDLDEAQVAYQDYIQSCVDTYYYALVHAVLEPSRDPQNQHDSTGSLIADTYRMAHVMHRDPATSKDERELLSRLLRLWVAVRLTTSSTVIIGEETLGMSRDIMPKNSPQHGKIPLPPVMGAQIDTILITNIQAMVRKELLERLQKMVQSNKPSTWITVYLSTFILLHNISLITRHDHNYAKKHGMERRWAREAQVQEYILGANILLAYFHYCNKGVFPFTKECRDGDLRTLAELDGRGVDFIRRAKNWNLIHRDHWDALQKSEAYEHEYFWVSQLYKHNWMPEKSM